MSAEARRPLRIAALQESAGRARYPRRHPAQPAAVVIDAPTRSALLQRECVTCGQGLRLTACAGAHPARSAGIGLVLRPQPDPALRQARCSQRAPQRLSPARAHSLTPLRSALHFIPFAPRYSRRWLGGIAAARPGTLLLMASLFSAPANHRPSPSPEHNIKPGTSSRHDVVAQKSAVLTSISATDTACRMRSRTSASSPHNAKSPCI